MDAKLLTGDKSQAYERKCSRGENRPFAPKMRPRSDNDTHDIMTHLIYEKRQRGSIMQERGGVHQSNVFGNGMQRTIGVRTMTTLEARNSTVVAEGLLLHTRRTSSPNVTTYSYTQRPDVCDQLAMVLMER